MATYRLRKDVRGYADESLLVEIVLDHITEDNCFRSRRYAEAGVDMLRIGDDVGMEDRMMMHPEM